MAEQVDMKVVEQKVKSGEKLTPAEVREVMSMPPEGFNGASDDPDDDLPESHFVSEETPKKAAAEAPAPKEPAKAPSAPVAPAKEAAKPSEPAPADEDHMARLQRELDKPEGQENLKDRTPSERAYFFEMRRERKRAQKAEADADVLRREKLQRDKKDKDEAATKEIDDVLKDKDPEDSVKVKDIQKLMTAQKKQTPKDTDAPKNIIDPVLVNALLNAHDREARAELGEDYDVTLECADDIIANNPDYLEKVSRALRTGENSAKVIYSLIKSDPEYAKALPAAKARIAAKGGKVSDGKTPKAPEKDADAEALAAQQALENNGKKLKTSAHTASEEAAPSKAYGNHTFDQLFNMSDRDFAKVEKKHRDAFMKDLSGV